MRVLITGANGKLGQRLIQRFAAEPNVEIEVVAAVRSAAAAATLEATLSATRPAAHPTAHHKTTIQRVDYHEPQTLVAAAAGCDTLVQLAGTIKESRQNPFHLVHEQACEALVTALSRPDNSVKQIIQLSVLGADPESRNACFRSRGRADNILLSGPIPTTVLRVPMVLGQGDFAAKRLAAQGAATFCCTFHAASLEQPIDSDDLIEAILRLSLSPGLSPEISVSDSNILQLAGPESLSRAALIHRASRCLAQGSIEVQAEGSIEVQAEGSIEVQAEGSIEVQAEGSIEVQAEGSIEGMAQSLTRATGGGRRFLPRVISLPLGLGYLLAGMLEHGATPPVTRAMLGVLDHDDQVDAIPACQALGIHLTPLDETLRKVLLG